MATAVPLDAAPAATAPPADVLLEVDLSRPMGPVNGDLIGFGWHPGGAPLTAVEPLQPHLIRIDGTLQDVSPGPGAALELGPLLDRVAAVRAIGAEPLVILSYLPAWLGAPHAAGRDPTRVRPADLDAWERLVHDVVLALATSPAPALRFEAWNEPDVPIFWQDTPAAWIETIRRSARAVAAVEAETGVDLHFGGPATAFPDPIYLVPFVAEFRDPSLPFDFVSWHYYGNYPFFGPDGAEFAVTEPIQPVLGRPNPIASPAVYGPQVDFVARLVEAGLAGSNRARPALVLDEWNLSAAGFDRRHDGAVGAAFATGVLTELQDAGLDAAAYFMATDTRGVPGEHGAATIAGVPKPVWWAFRLWRQLGATEVTVAGADANEGLWASAATDGDRVTVLVTAFRATAGPHPARTLEVSVPGAPGDLTVASLRRVDEAHPIGAAPQPIAVNEGRVALELPTPGVALLELGPAPTAAASNPSGSGSEAHPRAGSRQTPLPATGNEASPRLLLAAAVVLAVALAGRRWSHTMR